ncbi:hypothetical protein IWQ61_007151 [Dispira simplex]|nr:hypothetical protein IWQ61_007151 [Dispira simplex]
MLFSTSPNPPLISSVSSGATTPTITEHAEPASLRSQLSELRPTEDRDLYFVDEATLESRRTWEPPSSETEEHDEFSLDVGAVPSTEYSSHIGVGSTQLSTSDAAPITIARSSHQLRRSNADDGRPLSPVGSVSYSFTQSSIRHQSLALGNLELTEGSTSPFSLPGHTGPLGVPHQSTFGLTPPVRSSGYGTLGSDHLIPKQNINTLAESVPNHPTGVRFPFTTASHSLTRKAPLKPGVGSPLAPTSTLRHPAQVGTEHDPLLSTNRYPVGRRWSCTSDTSDIPYTGSATEGQEPDFDLEAPLPSPSFGSNNAGHLDPEPHSFMKRLSSNMNYHESIPARPLSFHPWSGATSHAHVGAKLGRRFSWQWLTTSFSYFPAVLLGTIFTLLDAISYGLIIFPVSMPAFESFGPTGLSMFLLSTVVCQLTFSAGASTFAGANGGMMIEAIPFLHTICEIIVATVGQGNDHSIFATTMVAYALSSIITGLSFLALGYFNLGALVDFFPRHILVGCIGGVGYFLIQTALEITGQVVLHFDLATLWTLFQPHVLALWGSSLLLALLLRVLCHRFTHPFFIPSFFLVVPVLFYAIAMSLGCSMTQLRDEGWVFQLPDADVPFYNFYLKFDFASIHWPALLKTLPAMFGLTFFGILHVPINVPALAVSTGKDDLDTNRELVAHGFSNLFTGIVGSVPNYLIYSNSLFFIRTGGDSRVAGLMLAAVTAGIMVGGTQIVGFMPTIVVGSLIFHLGIDLMKEALYNTWGVVNRIEYITISTIIVAMAGLGFIEGIFVGILLACFFFVFLYSRRRSARAAYTGPTARSTVRRLYRQRRFLDQVGSQIQVLQLQGFMFFGTITSVEQTIRQYLCQRRWNMQPIRFLVLDIGLVTGVDFSAAEAFTRIKRLLRAREVYFVVCRVDFNNEVGKALRAAKVCGTSAQDDPYTCVFSTLNEGLEWCENVLLETYYLQRSQPSYQDGTGGGSTQSTPGSPRQLAFNSHDICTSVTSGEEHSIVRSALTSPHTKAMSSQDLFKLAWNLNPHDNRLTHHPATTVLKKAGNYSPIYHLGAPGEQKFGSVYHAGAVPMEARGEESSARGQLAEAEGNRSNPYFGSSPRLQQVLAATQNLLAQERDLWPTPSSQVCDVSGIIASPLGSTTSGGSNTRMITRASHIQAAQPCNLIPPLGLLIQAFQDLDQVSHEDMLYTVSRCFIRHPLPAGAALWHAGTPAEGLYVVESGLLRLLVEIDGNVKSMESILPGTMVGELSFFTRRTRLDTVVAEVDSVLWKLPLDAFETWSQENPKLALDFTRLALCYSAQSVDNATTFAFYH